MANPGEAGGAMTEETGTSPASAGATGINPAAIALALGRTGPLDPCVAAYFEEQTKLSSNSALAKVSHV
jgi:hypothetical protein